MTNGSIWLAGVLSAVSEVQVQDLRVMHNADSAPQHGLVVLQIYIYMAKATTEHPNRITTKRAPLHFEMALEACRAVGLIAANVEIPVVVARDC